MLRSPKRITRKEIKQPDQFVTLTRECISFLTSHRTVLIASLSVLAATLAIFLGWDVYRGRQNRLAAAEYARAVAFYHKGNYKEALEALNRLQIYRATVYSRLGLLYTANSRAALQDDAKAVEALQQLIATEKKEPVLRQAALTSLAYTQETKGQCQEAASSFGEAEKIDGPLRGDATLGKARCSQLTGNFKEALASYRKFLTDNPASDRVNEISVRVQELEAKAAEGSGAAK